MMVSQIIHYGDPINRSNPITRGLVSWWKALPWWASGPRFLDLNNQSTGRNHGTLTNGTAWQSSMGNQKIYGSLFFDGSDDYVDIPPGTLPDAIQEVSIAFWMRRTAQTINYPPILIKSVSFAFSDIKYAVLIDNITQIGNGDLIEWNVGGGAGNSKFSTSSIADGVWTHVVCTNSAAESVIYWNGKRDTTGASMSAPAANAANWAMGRWSGGGAGGKYNGAIDDVMVFNRALSDSEVRQLYNRTPLNWVDPRQLAPLPPSGLFSLQDDGLIYQSMTRWAA